MRRMITAVCLLFLTLAFVPFAVPRAHAQEERFFPETGHTVRGRFLLFWNEHGGVPVFGYPLTEEAQENGRTVQYFERQRFELHPENQPPYDVELGRLGAELLAAQGVDWQTQPTASGPAAGCRYFEVTRHNVCDQQPGIGFLSYWTTHGLEFDGRAGKSFAESLALFGYPITEPATYINSSGDRVLTQWFERARFEWHPNNPNPYKVLLGRLGAEVRSPAMPGPTASDAAAAVETVLRYYDAINQQKYAEAYQAWANNGGASNQSFDQFRQGFANTVQITVLLGQPTKHVADPNDRAVDVPLTLLAVVNDPASTPLGQRVQQFRGSYTVQPTGANAWKLASASIAESSGALPLADVSSPTQTLQSYYDAINRGEFARAYTYWESLGQSSQQSFADFQHGFARTANVVIALGTPQQTAGAGSIFADVPILIFATQTDQSQQTFCGTYSLRRANVPPFDLFGWRIGHAQIAPTANVQPGSDPARRLLTNGCQS